jgi:CheY-like chemotaxis protein
LHQEGGWVVLLDLMMPRMDGWQVIRRLQQEPGLRKDSQVVLMSAGWRLDSEGAAPSGAPVVARLRKPVDLEELLTLANALARRDVG